MSRKALVPLIVASVIVLTLAVVQAETVKSRLGKLDFEGGYPSKKAIDRLYESLDLQRAVQAYLWALPVTGFAQWQRQQVEVFGAEDGDVVFYSSHRDKLGMLGPLPDTPYLVGFYDLMASGPMVLEYPAGETSGHILNARQQPIAELGLDGMDRGSGGKFLVMVPGQAPGNTDGFMIIESDTFEIMHGLRILSTDAYDVDRIRQSYRAYPHASYQDPRPTRVLTPEGRDWSGRPPGGLGYWELVREQVRFEPEHYHDRAIVAMLGPLGIDRRKPFAPDENQKDILEEAAVIGEATARSLSFALRDDNDVAYLDTHWHRPPFLGDYRFVDGAKVLDYRAARFFRTNGLNVFANRTSPGEGEARLITFRDKGGRWLQGDNEYRLRIPADVPADRSWTVTVYDAETRSFFDTESGIVGRNSRMDLAENEDGSVSLFFGPKEPENEDRKKNWIPTLPAKGWFAFLVVQDPTEPFFDESWQLPDIRRTDDDDDLYGGGG
jgi:hypothetical protein